MFRPGGRRRRSSRPTPLSAVALEPNERVVLVDVYMPAVRMAQNKSVNRHRSPAGLAERCRAGTEHQFLPSASGRTENTNGNLSESVCRFGIHIPGRFLFITARCGCTGANFMYPTSCFKARGLTGLIFGKPPQKNNDQVDQPSNARPADRAEGSLCLSCPA